MTRACCYIRVSDASQVEGHSLDTQERLFHELCKSRSWIPGQVYREEGKSAHSDSISKRPLFGQLLEDASKGQFDVVVVHTLDRWARNLKVLLESVSIMENLDWSTAEGRLVARTLGSFGEFFSDMLATHVKKGIAERARHGLHLGGIPFGYESCWEKENGEKKRRCEPEHPGGLHVHPQEGPAVTEIFRKYAPGITTLSQLAIWLNSEGFRTRNMRVLPDANGNLSSGPRLFTTASVRVILHNPFYTGKVKHHDQLLPGVHEPLVSEELFHAVQMALKRNSGRSRTLSPRPLREYLLKGLIRCAHCGYPMWAQTYRNGNRYYREEYGSRSAGYCVGRSGSMQCQVPDEQMGRIMRAIVLPDAWYDRLLVKIQLADEARRVEEERKQVEQRLKRLGQVYLDDLIPYDEYKRQKRNLEDQLQSLVVPGVDAAKEAGRLLEDLPRLWEEADLEERRKILLTMLEAVYVDTVEERAIVAIRPKPAFKALFEIATTQEGSEVVLYNESPPGGGTNLEGKSSCFWWRRGRVELYLKRGLHSYLAVLVAASWNEIGSQVPRTPPYVQPPNLGLIRNLPG